MLVNNFLEKCAENHPDKPAAWYRDQWMTFGAIETMANKIANFLKDEGIRRGDRVAILYENSFHYIAAYYGILKAGAVTVALNTDTTADALAYTLNHSGARAIVTNQKYSRHLLPALPRIPELTRVVIQQDDLSAYNEIGRIHSVRLQDVLENGKTGPAGVRCIDIDLASIVYTSGSTGNPKGVTLTHLNVITNTRSIVEYLELTGRDRIMVVLPFYYIYGKSLLNTHYFAGGSVVLDNRFSYPQVVLETMKKTGVTGFSGVPSTFMILLNKSAIRNYSFDTLRYVTQAGGAMAPAVQKEVVDVFHPAKVFIMYGATEASARLSYLKPDMLHKKWGSIGRAIPNVDLFVADEQGNRLPPNQPGEIVARGANMMAGYWRDPEGTQQVLKNGLYYTGDLGIEDDDGYYFVVGRSKDIIKPGGLRVSAKEIEEALLEMKEIHEVAVIGVEDDVLGEAIKACIVPREKARLEQEAVVKFLKHKLPPYKQPKYYRFLDSLPKNESGKVLKQVLKAQEKQN